MCQFESSFFENFVQDRFKKQLRMIAPIHKKGSMPCLRLNFD